MRNVDASRPNVVSFCVTTFNVNVLVIYGLLSNSHEQNDVIASMVHLENHQGGQPQEGRLSYLKGARLEECHRSPRSSRAPPGRFLLTFSETPPSINVLLTF